VIKAKSDASFTTVAHSPQRDAAATSPGPMIGRIMKLMIRLIQNYRNALAAGGD